jgi:uncharacterized protein YcaQ
MIGGAFGPSNQRSYLETHRHLYGELMTRTVSLAAARALAIHSQMLDTPNGAEPPSTLDTIDAVVRQLGCIQIDTLHVVARAHYMAMWSRLGSYDMADFDRLIFDPAERRLYEYWGHAASIMSLHDYPYRRWEMLHHQSNPMTWWSGWLNKDGNRELVRSVLERIRADGPMRVADFDYDGPKRGSWWDWKPAKEALEMLFADGELMVTRREKFQRVYDVKERVLPDWVDLSAATQEDGIRHTLTQSIRALGIADDPGIYDYAYIKRKFAMPVLKAMIADGTLAVVEVEVLGGKTLPMLIHAEDLPLLDQAEAGELKPVRTTFLNPFDSLFWAAERERRLWGFSNVLEAYKRAPDRIYGYYCLSILRGDALVGRFDPVVDRKKGVLTLKALYLEPGVKPEEKLVADVAAAMRDFMKFHNARDLVIDKSDPAGFGKKLLKAL